MTIYAAGKYALRQHLLLFYCERVDDLVMELDPSSYLVRI